MELINFLKNTFKPAQKIKTGTYSTRCFTKQNLPYKLLLKVDDTGLGRLVVNASTVLFLNQTSTEFVYHYINGKYGDEVVNFMQSKYRAEKSEVLADYEKLIDEIEGLLIRVDVNPESQLDGASGELSSLETSVPTKVDFYLTFRRTLDDESAVNELDLEQWKKILDRSLEIGIPQFVLVGGEPILRADVFDLITYSEEIGVVMGLVSSQTNLNNEIVAKLIASGLDHLSVVVPIGSAANWQLLQHISDMDLYFKVVFEIDNANADNLMGKLAECRSNGVEKVSFDIREKMNQDKFDALFDKVDELNLTFVPFNEITVHDGTGKDLVRFAQNAPDSRRKMVVMPDGMSMKLVSGEWKTYGSLLDGDVMHSLD